MNQQERQQFLAHWESVRRRGAFQYVSLTALSWATFSAIVIRLVFILVEEGISREALISGFTSQSFLVFWAVFLVGGCCYAITMWYYYQKAYRRCLRQAAEEEENFPLDSLGEDALNVRQEEPEKEN